MSLIPPEALTVLQEETARQYDTTVFWVSVLRDMNGNVVRDKAGKPEYDTANYRTLDARIVQVDESFYNMQGIQLVAAERIYLPPNTNVRMEDKILHNTVDPTSSKELQKAPQIIDVREMPSPAESIFELVRTGSAAASGSPLGT